MQQRFIVLIIALFIVLTGVSPGMKAQGTTPQTYSVIQDPGFALFGANVVKVSRDGSKEAIDQTMPPGPGRDKEYHSRRLYDFQVHKLYLRILSDPAGACRVQDFNDSTAPAELDPISGAEALLKELVGDGQMKQVGTETVNGIAAKVFEESDANGKGKIWIAQNGGFPVKIVAIGADGKEQTVIEVKQLSLARPPASDFILPAGCESVELPIKPSTNVTALTLQAIPKYTGPCPARITMTGTITADGPGTVFYQFGAGKMDPGETIVFTAAGTKTVTHVMTLQPTYGNDMGAGAILEAIGADAAGKHGIPTKGSNNADFTITCTSGGGR